MNKREKNFICLGWKLEQVKHFFVYVVSWMLKNLTQFINRLPVGLVGRNIIVLLKSWCAGNCQNVQSWQVSTKILELKLYISRHHQIGKSWSGELCTGYDLDQCLFTFIIFCFVLMLPLMIDYCYEISFSSTLEIKKSGFCLFIYFSYDTQREISSTSQNNY